MRLRRAECTGGRQTVATDFRITGPSKPPHNKTDVDREKTMTTTDTRPLHWAATMYADECRQGKLSRREFLTRTTALGVSPRQPTA